MGIADVLGKIAGDKPVVLELDLARGVLVTRPAKETLIIGATRPRMGE